MRDLAILDVDGTLFMAWETALAGLRAAGAELGQRYDEGLAASLLGASGEAACAALEPDPRRRAALREAWRRHERRAVEERGRLFPGATELLAGLDELGFDLAVCTNGSGAYAELVLRATGIARRVREIGSIA